MIKERKQCIMFVIIWSILSMMVTSAKLLYAESRPYWSNSDIPVGECSTSFGNPSGHTFMTFTSVVFMWLMYYPRIKNTLLKVACTVAAFLLPAMTAYGRVRLGQHSADQVIYGFMLAMWLVLTFYYLVRPKLLKHLERLYRNEAALYAWSIFKFCIVCLVIMGAMLWVQLLVVHMYGSFSLHISNDEIVKM